MVPPLTAGRCCILRVDTDYMQPIWWPKRLFTRSKLPRLILRPPWHTWSGWWVLGSSRGRTLALELEPTADQQKIWKPRPMMQMGSTEREEVNFRWDPHRWRRPSVRVCQALTCCQVYFSQKMGPCMRIPGDDSTWQRAIDAEQKWRTLKCF